MWGWAIREASDDGVPSEEIWVLDLCEHQVCIVHICSRAGGAEGQHAAGGKRVFGQACLDQLGVNHLEVSHSFALCLQHGKIRLVRDQFGDGIGWGSNQRAKTRCHSSQFISILSNKLT